MRNKLVSIFLSASQKCRQLKRDSRCILSLCTFQQTYHVFRGYEYEHALMGKSNYYLHHDIKLEREQHGFSHGFQYGQKRTMFIQTQSTPNPQSLMFMPGRTVMESGTFEASNARAAMVSPLAKKLFTVDGICGVFFGSDFITVTKKEEVQWSVLKPHIFAAIMDHFGSGQLVISDPEALSETNTMIAEDDDEVVAMIKELLETRIRPSVQEDGGDIHYRGFEPNTGIVSVRMVGACRGCSSSAITLKSGIENMLMHYVPEVKGVEQVEEVDFEDYDPLHPESNPLAKHLSA